MAQALNPNRAGLQVISDNGPDGSRVGAEKNIFIGRNELAKGADIASATSITLGDGNYFELTGSNPLTTIVTDGWQIGSVIRLHLPSTVTISLTDGNLKGVGGSFSPTEATGGNITFILHDETNWHETSRADLTS